MAKTQSSAMWLVYVDEGGGHHYQPWGDLTEAGTLIDPENGDDMDLIGWTTELPEAQE
ncbi:hypothetical protein MUG78_17840 [Gordonia alkaliphila]|uniref:hypothetical protein n=1 Tax=Gordonia alkaliphila TaxID=1053547 RepID=UPI001FF6D261|nr:hypothetical protein [Gordonia alkaliphila]MCK0441264.1 hypothetical protein [Gordonia alkaliphila]